MSDRQHKTVADQNARADHFVVVLLRRFAGRPLRRVATRSLVEHRCPAQVWRSYDGAIPNSVSSIVPEFLRLVLGPVDVCALTQSVHLGDHSARPSEINEDNQNQNNRLHDFELNGDFVYVGWKIRTIQMGIFFSRL